MSPQDLHNALLHRDDSLIVLNKPAGSRVHKGPGRGKSLDAYFHVLRFGRSENPALAHRLDRETSGCLVLGRSKAALKRLGQLFAENRVRKTYWALVVGTPPKKSGVMDLALRRIDQGRGRWRIVPAPGRGKRAVTCYRLLAEGEGVSLLELTPQTGRTHQLRVHTMTMDCPIVGDRRYGKRKLDQFKVLRDRTVAHLRAESSDVRSEDSLSDAREGGDATERSGDNKAALIQSFERGLGPMMLHARAIEIPYAEGEESIHVRAPLPGAFSAMMAGCGISLILGE